MKVANLTTNVPKEAVAAMLAVAAGFGVTLDPATVHAMLLADDSPQIPPGTLLKIPDVAKRLQCSNRTVWRLCDVDGPLPKVLLGNRSARIPEQAVADFVATKA